MRMMRGACGDCGVWLRRVLQLGRWCRVREGRVTVDDGTESSCAALVGR